MNFLRSRETNGFLPAILVLLLASSFAQAQQRRKVIIHEDCSGPGGSNLQTLLVMIQSPQVEVLGITVVSGDQWRDEEVAHTLRLLEIIGRTDIPVVPGAVFPPGTPPRRSATVAGALRKSSLRRSLG
jgi:inosine-uridine nucleoside N-ribohydrolase